MQEDVFLKFYLYIFYKNVFKFGSNKSYNNRGISPIVTVSQRALHLLNNHMKKTSSLLFYRRGKAERR